MPRRSWTHAGAGLTSPAGGDLVAVPEAQVRENLQIEHPTVVDAIVVVLAAKEEIEAPLDGGVPAVVELPIVEASGCHQPFSSSANSGPIGTRFAGSLGK